MITFEKKYSRKKIRKIEHLITWKVRLNGFLNPLRGRRRRNGVWPPSKPNFMVPLAFWPLCPLPAVFPLPDPIPRPFRFFFFLGTLFLRSFSFKRLTVAGEEPIPATWPYEALRTP